MSTPPERTTADDGSKAKNRHPVAISGARAEKMMKAAVADTIFTLCGGHGTARRD